MGSRHRGREPDLPLLDDDLIEEVGAPEPELLDEGDFESLEALPDRSRRGAARVPQPVDTSRTLMSADPDADFGAIPSDTVAQPLTDADIAPDLPPVGGRSGWDLPPLEEEGTAPGEDPLAAMPSDTLDGVGVGVADAAPADYADYDEAAPELEPLPPEPAKYDDYADYDDVNDTGAQPIPPGLGDTGVDAEPAAGRLVVLRGPARGEQHLLQGSAWTVGRAATNDFVIKDARLSREHLEVFVDDDGLAVRDLGSSAGTMVNGHTIDCVYVGDGDVIEAGDTVLRIDEGSSAHGALDLDRGLELLDPDAAPAEAAEVEAEADYALPEVPEAAPDEAEPEAPKARSRKKKTTETDAKAPKAPMDKRRKRMILYASIGGAMALFFVLAAVMKGGKAPATQGASVAAAKAQAAEQDAAGKAFLEAIELFKREEWAQARGKLKRAEQAFPNHPKVQAYLEAVEAETLNQERLQKARGMLNEGRGAEAGELLALISESSFYFDEAQEIRETTKKASADTGKSLDAARHALERGDYEDAIAEVDNILDLSPEHREARRLKREIRDAQEAAERGDEGHAHAGHDHSGHDHASHGRSSKRSSRNKKKSGRNKKKNQAKRERSSRRSASVAAPGDARGQAISLFKSGKGSEAIKGLERAGASRSGAAHHRLYLDMKAFAEAYLGGIKDAKTKQASSAIKKLETALKKERKIAGGKSLYAKKIRNPLADMYYIRGRFAFGRKQYPSAYSDWAKAVKYNPKHEYAPKGLADLAKMAKKLYYEGYVVRNFDPKAAREKWNLVIRITPPKNEWHKKAKERLAD